MKATASPKKRLGPPSIGNGELIGVHLQPDMLAGIDQFVAEHDVTRPEAVRLIIADWMDKHQVIRGE